MSVIDFIVITVLSILLVISSAVAVANRVRRQKTLSLVAQLLIDKAAMSEEIDRLTFTVDNSSDLNDGFVKFLSESREEAFSYITDVQEAIALIKDAMDLGDEPQINEAYARLISFLPNENPDVVN